MAARGIFIASHRKSATPNNALLNGKLCKAMSTNNENKLKQIDIN